MDKFIGGVGTAAILTAAVFVIAKLLFEAGVVKDSQTLKKFTVTYFYVFGIGAVYLAFAAYVKSVASGSVNMFDFGGVFEESEGFSAALALVREPELSKTLSGMNMPLYPYIAHLAGRICMEEYDLAGMWLNFMFAVAAAWLLRLWTEPALGEKRVCTLTLTALCLPGAFALFYPGGAACAAAFAMAACLAADRGRSVLSAVLMAAAVLMHKTGIILLLPYIWTMAGGYKKLVRSGKPVTVKPAVKYAAQYVLIGANALLIYAVIGGAWK